MRRRYRRMGRNPGVIRKPLRPPAPPRAFAGKQYVPDVRPFMRQYGYTEGLEEILAEIDRLQNGTEFYYEQGDLWRKKP